MKQNQNNQCRPQPISSNLIMISHTNLQSIQSQVSCKFCLQKGGELISPCQCKGSLQFVYINCIKQGCNADQKTKIIWDIIEGQNNQKCEICKQYIGFSYVTTKYCSCHTFFQRIKTKKSLFSYIFGMFVFMIALGGLLYSLIKSNMESNLSSITIVLIVIFQVLLLVWFILIVVNCIFEYFISREILITRVQNKNKMVHVQ